MASGKLFQCFICHAPFGPIELEESRSVYNSGKKFCADCAYELAADKQLKLLRLERSISYDHDDT